MSVVEELADLLREDGSYDVYTGPHGIDLYRYACTNCVPFEVVYVVDDYVYWGPGSFYGWELCISKTGLEDIAAAILSTLKNPQ